MPNIDEKIGTILAKLEAIDEKIETHLDDYKVTKALMYKMKERQIAAVFWVIGSFGSGAGVVGLVAKLIL